MDWKKRMKDNVDKLIYANEKLKAALKNLRSKYHYECDDCWYSCPKSGQCCNDNEKDGECNCGTDYRNAIIDKVLSEILK